MIVTVQPRRRARSRAAEAIRSIVPSRVGARAARPGKADVLNLVDRSADQLRIRPDERAASTSTSAEHRRRQRRRNETKRGEPSARGGPGLNSSRKIRTPLPDTFHASPTPSRYRKR